jgi:hypothetical protein
MQLVARLSSARDNHLDTKVLSNLRNAMFLRFCFTLKYGDEMQ